MMGYPPVAIAARRQAVVVERSVPVVGEVLVGHGRRVQPNTPIARADEAARPFAWFVQDLAASDGKEPSVRLVKSVGDEIKAGENIGMRRGFLGREKAVCPSPVDGILAGADLERGHVVIAPKPRKLEVFAGVEGTVVEVLAGRGALVVVPGLYGQGVAMVGDEVWGRLQVGSSAASAPLSLQSSATDAIVVVGHLDENGLAAATKAGARAIIAGSTPLSVWRGLLEGRWPDLTVLLVDGFGQGGMNERSYREYAAVGGAAALLTQARSGLGPLGRPEIVVSLPGSNLPERDLPRLEPGAAVRLVTGSACGGTGSVVALPGAPVRLAGGRARAVAVVSLDSGGRATVPVDSLELLG
jgi:hypothetical protein